MPAKLTDAVVSEAITLYESGLQIKQVAQNLSIAERTVAFYLKKHSIVLRKSGHPQALQNRAIALYVKGSQPKEIVRILGGELDPGTVWRWAKKAGKAHPPVRHASDTRHEMVRLYKKGLGCPTIEKLLGVNQGVIRHTLKKAGLHRSIQEATALLVAKHPLVWGEMNPAQAWVLGLIYGNGAIHADGGQVSLRMANDDVDVLHKVRGVLGINNVLTRSTGCRELAITSRKFNAIMRKEFGLTENKGKNLPWPNLDSKLLPHFIRGLYDSDGSWYFRTGRRSHLLVLSFSSVSLDFVFQLEETLGNILPVSRHPVRITQRSDAIIEGRAIQNSPIATLAYSHIDAIEIGKWLYANTTEEIRGDRKHSIWASGSQVILHPGHVRRHLERVHSAPCTTS